MCATKNLTGACQPQKQKRPPPSQLISHWIASFAPPKRLSRLCLPYLYWHSLLLTISFFEILLVLAVATNYNLFLFIDRSVISLERLRICTMESFDFFEPSVLAETYLTLVEEWVALLTLSHTIQFLFDAQRYYKASSLLVQLDLTPFFNRNSFPDEDTGSIYSSELGGYAFNTTLSFDKSTPPPFDPCLWSTSNNNT